MVVELRPTWCIDDAQLADALELHDWCDSRGVSLSQRNGDHWKPGEGVVLRRRVELRAEPIDVRRQLGLRSGTEVGIAARWTCRKTFSAGVHAGGPTPLPLQKDVLLELEIPSTIAGEVEVETCLVAISRTDGRADAGPPDRGLIWSDGWTLPGAARALLLEGSELRIPVRTISFEESFGARSFALWAVDVDPATQLDDPIANMVTIYLNRDVLRREFAAPNGEPDAALIPPSAESSISVELIRLLAVVCREQIEDDDAWADFPEGSVGAVLILRLTEAFGSPGSAIAELAEDPGAFSRDLWRQFAPETWRDR